MTPAALRLIFLKMFMKLRKQIKTAANCQISDICKKVFFVCIVCAKKKEKRERKAPPHPIKERVEKKRKR